MHLLRTSCALAALSVFALKGLAQDLLHKGAPQQAPVVLRNASLHTVSSGVLLGGTLWFQDGVLRGVHPAGEEPKLPDGAQPVVVDLQGKHVFPGMVAVGSQLGLVEIGSVRQTVDTDEVGELSPEALALVAVNPDTTGFPVTRQNGVLASVLFPTGGLLPGRASAIELDGWTNAELSVVADVGVVVGWPARGGGGFGRRGMRPTPGGTAGGDDGEATKKARQRIDEAFAAARSWLDAYVADATIPIDVRHQALVSALRGEARVFLLASEQEQIESAVRWAVGRGLRAVVVGGRDAVACADLLRRHAVPVVVTGVHRLPTRDDAAYDEAFTLPKRLQDAGVRFCIACGGEPSNERNLPYHAATAAAFGLGRDRALAAVTLDAAEIAGVGEQLGSLSVGKHATLFVADGHPFDLSTRIEQAYVRGRAIDLRSKHSELAAKYRARYRQLRGK
jgi:imidazolonepropionase-like amidohydrolase